MAIRVGINGFGRIGRVVFRLLMERADEFELCGINLRNADIPHMVYMVRYDSIHGRFPGTIEEGENSVIVNGKAIPVFSETDPAQIPWASCGAEYIIESTGAFNTVEKSSGHLKGGAKKVVITAPSKDKVMPTYVMGVNHTEYKPEYDVVSNASCTTNCLAPLVKVVNDAFGIEEGLMSTIHSATASNRRLLTQEPAVTGEPAVPYSTTLFRPPRAQPRPAGDWLSREDAGQADRYVLPRTQQ